MGTRGFTGFMVDGEIKISYQQYDSYPDGVGVTVLNYLKSGPVDMAAKARALRVVTDETPVTDADIASLGRFADTAVSTGDLREWYVLLRATQGDPAAILEAGTVLSALEFTKESLFCEWGYLINIDEGCLEVYQGFVTEPHNCVGRFAELFGTAARESYPGGPEYYPVTLVKRFSFDEIGALTPAEFALACDPESVGA